MDDSGSEISEATKEGNLFTSKLELQLAASIVDALIERNGGREIADRFWDDNSIDSIDDGDACLDTNLWDPDEEHLTEMEEI